METNRTSRGILCATIAGLFITAALNAQPASEWRPLFDGKSLHGWHGDPSFWTVEDQALTGTTTVDNRTGGNTFLIYIGDHADKSPVEFADFELKLKYRVTGHNSGIQYRSFVLKGERSTVTGSAPKTLPNGRTVDSALRTTEVLPDREKLKQSLKTAPKWNEMHIIARGHRSLVKINGVTMSELSDEDQANRRTSGLIAIQLHAGPPMKIQVKDIRIRNFENGPHRSAALSAFHRRIGHRCDLCLPPLP